MKIDIGAEGKILGTKRVSPNGQVSGLSEYAGEEVLIIYPGPREPRIRMQAGDYVHEVEKAVQNQMKVAFQQYKALKSKYKDEATRLIVGDDNTFREHATIHRSNKLEEPTIIGSHNYFMTESHVGHNCVVGNHVILVSGAKLAGHVTVGDRALLSGNCCVHQFVRVGGFSLMQGNSAISQDLPPFTICQGINTLAGLNVVGLRRAGVLREERLELKKAYHLLFNSTDRLAERIEKARQACPGPYSRQLIDFVASTTRGICSPRGWSRSVEADNAPDSGSPES